MNLKTAGLIVIAVLIVFFISRLFPEDAMNGASISTVSPSERELVIYTYDGITSDWGLGPKIFPKFESQCDCKVKIVAKGDVGSIVSQLIFEKNAPKADIALGIDNTFKQIVKKEELLEPHEPPNIDELDESLIENDRRFIPFDWGYLAFVYDSEEIQSPPKNLEELTSSQFSKKIIIEDARTSSPGKVFLYWVAREYGENTRDYLERLKPNLLTVTPGWSEAYNLFLQGEAPMVLSYSTSPAYHLINENTDKYKAAIFPRMYKQIEYVGIVKNPKNRELAEQFIEFMISEEVQKEIPLGNYMYPARKNIQLPEAFTLVKSPEESMPEIEDGGKWLRIWEEVFSN